MMARSRSIRFRLLMAVNAAMAIPLLVFLVLDYNREFAERVTEKRIALEEEAKTLLPGVSRARSQGTDAVQQYVDSVCGAMQDVHSPGHHIAVRLDGSVLQAHAHHRASSEMFRAMEAAAQSPDHQARIGSEELVVGIHRKDDLTVFVSEHLTNVRQSVRRQILPRLGGIVLVAVVAAVVINLIFLRMVAGPLNRLVDTVRQISHGELGAQTGPFNSDEFTHLGNAINAMSQSLAETDRQRRQEMAKARHIQEHLLPDEFAIPGLTVAHLYQPAADVAGDYYDIRPLPDGSWLLCVADVTGHGVPAAMTAAMLKTQLLHACEKYTDPVTIVRQIDQQFAAVSLTEDFATMLLARWIPQTGTLEYVSAGHETGFLISADGTLHHLSSTGLLVGIHEQGTWEMRKLPVGVGDRLALVSDGVTETCSPQDILFGREQLADVLMRWRHETANDTIAKIDCTLAEHRGDNPPRDDVTIVVVDFVNVGT